MVRKYKSQLEPPRIKKGSKGRQQKRKQEREDAEAVENKKKRAKCPTVLEVNPNPQEKQQLLPTSSREHLEATIHWLITSVLYKTTQNHNEIRKHLNLLKKRLLNSFETIQVPVRKLNSWGKVHTILAEEKKKTVAIEDDSEELQKELDKVLQATELNDNNIKTFQNKVQKLKGDLAAEEAASNKLFQRDGKYDLFLPDIFEDCTKAPILQVSRCQNELLKVRNQPNLLHDLNTIQQSDEMKTLSMFLEQVYEM
ncbi:centromere protein Q isoform X2 [Anolis carolinensis]|uniref:centromere protein Q isoform X2 n=1 Tax=Anolis carolinensis TaxID=28377 RepID=UPI0004625870|nr:PREDICTED: centromere protein Q isoform X2 [Anolis carolinensis]|eukprot:XP_008115003.1 PREDICTED: centromere protein Q isoform X2 [Anolis carolinensis]